VQQSLVTPGTEAAAGNRSAQQQHSKSTPAAAFRAQHGCQGRWGHLLQSLTVVILFLQAATEQGLSKQQRSSHPDLKHRCCWQQTGSSGAHDNCPVMCFMALTRSVLLARISKTSGSQQAAFKISCCTPGDLSYTSTAAAAAADTRWSANMAAAKQSTAPVPACQRRMPLAQPPSRSPAALLGT
jgi:hypothetical protein